MIDRLKYILISLVIFNIIYLSSRESFRPIEMDVQTTLNYLNSALAQSLNSTIELIEEFKLQEDDDKKLNNGMQQEAEVLAHIPKTELLQSIEEFKEGTARNQTVCASWDVNVDDWWLHQPDWYPSFESPSHYCFSPIQDAAKADFMRQLYQNQYHGNCSNAVYKRLIGWGWGLDFLWLIDGLMYGLENKRPLKMATVDPWHYALPNTPKGLGVVEPKKVCESADMECFFLPISNCPTFDNDRHEMIKQDFYPRNKLRFDHYRYKKEAYWLLDYAKRPMHWLRKRVAEYVEKQNVTAPCTAMHVRRGDITMDRGHRRFYPIEDYVHADPKIHNNVFLITDDANAISEAKFKFPNLTWQYIDRPRYRGSEAGFKKHTPSGDGAHEVTVLMTLARLVRRCDQMVRAVSGFSDYLYNEMVADGKEREVFRVKEDYKFGKSLDDLRKSVNISQSFNTSDA